MSHHSPTPVPVRSTRLSVALVVTVGLPGANPAAASPSGYGTAPCNPDGTNVCSFNGITKRWTCELSEIGETGEVQAWMVFGESSVRSSDCSNVCDGAMYCAFGIQNGERFYCKLYEGESTKVMNEGWLVGTTGRDVLSFWYEEPAEEGPGLKCGMMNHRVDDLPLLVGKATGNSGDELIHGSWGNRADYLDELYGDADDDAIYAHEGDDEVHGGEGLDTLHGGAGHDDIYGEDGDDNASCGPGNDMFYGGNNADDVCGDDGDDVLFGQYGYDYLWGDADYDVGEAGGLGALCGVDLEVGDCTTTPYRPTTCPGDVEPY